VRRVDEIGRACRGDAGLPDHTDPVLLSCTGRRHRVAADIGGFIEWFERAEDGDLRAGGEIVTRDQRGDRVFNQQSVLDALHQGVKGPNFAPGCYARASDPGATIP